MADGVKQKIDVLCPRCGRVAGTVFAWFQTEYSATYDEKAKADQGKVDVEVKVADSTIEKWASSSLRLDHTCLPDTIVRQQLLASAYGDEGGS